MKQATHITQTRSIQHANGNSCTHISYSNSVKPCNKRLTQHSTKLHNHAQVCTNTQDLLQRGTQYYYIASRYGKNTAEYKWIEHKQTHTHTNRSRDFVTATHLEIGRSKGYFAARRSKRARKLTTARPWNCATPRSSESRHRKFPGNRHTYAQVRCS